MTRDFASIARQYGIRLIVQFGSTVTGHTHARSDIDVAVLFAGDVDPLTTYGELAAALQSLFPDRTVDVVVLNHADPLLAKQVLDGARLLFGELRELAELRMYAFRRYQDHRPYLAMEREYVRRKTRAVS